MAIFNSKLLLCTMEMAIEIVGFSQHGDGIHSYLLPNMAEALTLCEVERSTMLF